MQLAKEDLFRGRWTEQILDECFENLVKDKPHIPAERWINTRQAMNEAVREPLITGYEGLIGSLSLPDENDRHVLAAAILGGADVIVTKNLKDFPDAELDKYGIEAQHPDDFLMHALDLNPELVCHALKTIRARLASPAKTVDEYLATLNKNGLNKFVAALQAFKDKL